jgi:hypothetical protein
MSAAGNRVAIIGLVTRFLPPVPASPRTRARTPEGYGVQEQCLPFTAAAALGLTIPSPFTWGFCTPAAVPTGARRFRSPVPGGCTERCFYVIDDAELGFRGNQFDVPAEVQSRAGPAPLPGLSFFDRNDQQDHVKVHLPYVWRTDPGVHLLFTSPLNRSRGDGLEVLAGLVETAWYTNPINLVVRLPERPLDAHVSGGEPLAQAVPVAANACRLAPDLVAPHRREARDVHGGVRAWRAALDSDRAAYKRQARTVRGMVPDSPG